MIPAIVMRAALAGVEREARESWKRLDTQLGESLNRADQVQLAHAHDKYVATVVACDAVRMAIQLAEKAVA